MKTWETAGLFVAWALHDTEEGVTAGSWSRGRGANPNAPRWLNRLPWMNHEISDRQMRSAITAMGAFVGSAAIAGYRTQGRSSYFRAAVLGFGLHGIGHLAASATLRSYTPGVATAPLTVLPYAAWALRRTRNEHGPLRAREVAMTALLVPVALVAAHAVGAVVENHAGHALTRSQGDQHLARHPIQASNERGG